MDGGLDVRGLSEKEAAARLKAEGPNALPQADRRTFIGIRPSAMIAKTTAAADDFRRDDFDRVREPAPST